MCMCAIAFVDPAVICAKRAMAQKHWIERDNHTAKGEDLL